MGRPARQETPVSGLTLVLALIAIDLAVVLRGPIVAFRFVVITGSLIVSILGALFAVSRIEKMPWIYPVVGSRPSGLGLMLWLSRKTLSGSYWVLTEASRR